MYRITAIVWHSHSATLRKAAAKVRDHLNVKVYSARYLQEGKEDLDAARADLAQSDLIFLYRSTGETVWEELEGLIRELDRPVVCVAHDPALWVLSTVPPEVVTKCYAYIVQNGEENFARMLRYAAAVVLGAPFVAEEPLVHPWEGIYHPDAPEYFVAVEDYLDWYQRRVPMVGLLFARHQWVNNTLAVENALIRALEAKSLGVIPVFCYSLRDEGLGTKGSGEVVREYFLGADSRPRIAGLVKLLPFFLSARARTDDFLREGVAASGIELLKQLGVPVFQPVVSFYKTIDEWAADPQGLSQDLSWCVALPEFEGVIEPVFLGAARREGDLEVRQPVSERVERIADRVAMWVRVGKKPAAERRVAFVLHNNPCASVEATVGSGANLDTLESVARILKRMQEAGYTVEPPASGKELIDTIMNRKAVSEFRWTTTDEIVSKGGALKLMPAEEYREWFDTLSPKVKERLIDAWGNPPGEPKNGVPAAMVHGGQIVITGVRYGNAVVCVQPKRGCAGARCDGQVCKILHDPDIPPPHQYLATYQWLERGFGADAVVHVGTHGNLEFLPGKGVGLSGDCCPDLAIGVLPHLYIYNADNPPEGTIAKRRSYATLVDHMQTVFTQGGLYDELAELDRYLEEYERARVTDPARAHTLEHLIMEEIKKANLDKQIPLDGGHENFAAVVDKAHAVLSVIRNTQIQDGQHIFGEIPQGERRIDFLNAILRYDAGEEVSLRRTVARLMGLELAELLADQGRFSMRHGKSHGALLERIAAACKAFIGIFLKGRPVAGDDLAAVLGEDLLVPERLEELNALLPRVLDLNQRVEASHEIEALLDGFAGRYIPAGPSGLITRGRDDVLPTGRNFYSLDPHRVPTRAAWEVGKRLAEKVLAKHLTEEGRYPENVALYWMCNDIMWADGEGLGQMFYLLGVRPKWLPNGRVAGVEVISLKELGRPRIDLTVRVSGITRDNFPNCVELLDEAIQTVAALYEPPEKNFVRKHTLAQLDGTAEDPQAWRDATLRIFASKPGTYQAGVNLAVYASAWKEEKDLADVFVYWNGYAYGKGVFGKEAFGQLQASLKTVDVTYNKVVSDEHDLFGCCCYFGAHGGMTAAARVASGKDVRTYYGDTREPEHVEVRTLADEIRRVVRTKLLNPKWIEGQKRHGYKGAGDMSKRVGRVYGWEASTREVDDWIFDDITRTFVLDEENRRFFEEHNPWALEEIARRLLEAANRGLWDAEPEMLERLKDAYLEIEGWLEERMGDVKGDFQGGAIDILTAEEVADWGAKMREIKAKLGS
ncbi:cobaltochelatase subunit CobN [Candidatus Desulforudis audaxviator]|uniref:Cobaltochelatase n=1 Tax=Desulforudis audaxviator (strain MP104C) TaxID=477974 RepID=B1I3U5_DESAP|nr:cobaltochelatase subunit CobN [Candidatus Desulforudis audaxviator]ACA59730.1 Cobaltochelatase [Candidatus Desulforudis audaxviator MP104C]AZK59724.1 CobN component of cobalt chelatase involved in B12 biosynthesis [Candidatus Desulforudis audaxviator]